MKFARKSKVANAIPTASMADISFLLLVFFMVSTVFVRFRGLPVELPDAEKIEKLESRRHVTSIWINRKGNICIDCKDSFDTSNIVLLDRVGAKIHAKLTANPRLIIMVKADADADFGLVSDVLQELRKVEALRVNFATDRERIQ